MPHITERVRFTGASIFGSFKPITPIPRGVVRTANTDAPATVGEGNLPTALRVRLLRGEIH